MSAISSDCIEHIGHYVHGESWETSSTGNASTFKAAYMSGLTDDGIYVLKVSNNTGAGNNAQYYATGALFTINLTSLQTVNVFYRGRSVSGDSSTSTWFFLKSGAIIDVYYIAKEKFNFA